MGGSPAGEKQSPCPPRSQFDLMRARVRFPPGHSGGIHGRGVGGERWRGVGGVEGGVSAIV